jgi:hypothetical protein
MWLKNIKILIVFLVLPAIMGSTECSFVANSDTRSSDEENRNGLVIIIQDGQLVDGPVEGVRFESGALSGITGPNGEFRFEEGNTVAFFIGDIALGSPVPGKSRITPLDLVPGGDMNTPAVINIARLLQSLDAVAADDRITIPAQVHALAQRSSSALGASIDALDFADDMLFVNAASQLVATLTQDYDFTAVLVDAATARRHLENSLNQADSITVRARVPAR